MHESFRLLLAWSCYVTHPASPIIRNEGALRFAMFPTACVYDDFVVGTALLLLERRPCSHTRMNRRRNRKQRRNCTVLFPRDVGPFTTGEPHEASPVVLKNTRVQRGSEFHSLFGHLDCTNHYSEKAPVLLLSL
jgi:hypothetical protein